MGKYGAARPAPSVPPPDFPFNREPRPPHDFADQETAYLHIMTNLIRLLAPSILAVGPADLTWHLFGAHIESVIR